MDDAVGRQILAELCTQGAEIRALRAEVAALRQAGGARLDDAAAAVLEGVAVQAGLAFGEAPWSLAALQVVVPEVEGELARHGCDARSVGRLLRAAAKAGTMVAGYHVRRVGEDREGALWSVVTAGSAGSPGTGPAVPVAGAAPAPDHARQRKQRRTGT